MGLPLDGRATLVISLAPMTSADAEDASPSVCSIKLRDGMPGREAVTRNTGCRCGRRRHHHSSSVLARLEDA